MNNTELRFQVQAMLESQIIDFMNRNQIPAQIIDDALSKVLLTIKDRELQEYLISCQQQKEQESTTAQGLQEEETADNG